MSLPQKAKPCPFCKGEPHINVRTCVYEGCIVNVSCLACNAEGPSQKWLGDPKGGSDEEDGEDAQQVEVAIELWNERQCSLQKESSLSVTEVKARLGIRRYRKNRHSSDYDITQPYEIRYMEVVPGRLEVEIYNNDNQEVERQEFSDEEDLLYFTEEYINLKLGE